MPGVKAYKFKLKTNPPLSKPAFSRSILAVNSITPAFKSAGTLSNQSRLAQLQFPVGAASRHQSHPPGRCRRLQSGASRRSAPLSKAFDNFFRRVKAGQKPGYPRFKGQGVL
ncbi:MAG: hypothetical protein IPJ07_17640 [Acidobacteria bacterium]|nr:hypothetical protein [Acidobacteriota bacterium]